MKRPIPGGFLLAIEGIDGAGKSLQAQAVAQVLQTLGLDCLLTREPTNGPWGKLLRESATRGRLAPQEELHAFLEDRKAHVRDLIRPSLAAGKIVLTDRYYFSTVAYQGVRGFDPAQLLKQNEAIAVEPHLLILIDLDPEVGMARIGHRASPGDQFESGEELAKVRAIFLSLRKPYLVRLDGRARPDDIRDDILRAFFHAAAQSISAHQELSPREKLNALLELHGGRPLTD